MDRPAGQIMGAVGTEGHHRGSAQRPDRLLLHARAVGADGQAMPVRGGQQRPAHRDGMAQRVAQDRQAGQVHPAQPGEHPRGHGAVEDGVLQRVAIDQHRRRQRPETRHADGVERLAARPSQVHPPGGDRVDHLGLVAGRVVAPLVDDLDLDRSAGQRPDPPNEARHRRGWCVRGVGHPQHHRAAGLTARLIGARRSAAAGGHGYQGEREQGACLRKLHVMLPAR